MEKTPCVFLQSEEFEPKALGCASVYLCNAVFSQELLSLCQENICVFDSCVFIGSQMLCVSVTKHPREVTHLELKYYHKRLGISDGYWCG